MLLQVSRSWLQDEIHQRCLVLLTCRQAHGAKLSCWPHGDVHFRHTVLP